MPCILPQLWIFAARFHHLRLEHADAGWGLRDAFLQAYLLIRAPMYVAQNAQEASGKAHGLQPPELVVFYLAGLASCLQVL